MRIVSLLPSATEIVAALGLADQLVGISHECDYPLDVVRAKPVLTFSAIPAGLSPEEIDALVSGRLRRGESLYLLDEALLEALQPDLILTQELCAVCAVSSSTVRDVACRLSSDPRVISLDPGSIAGIFETIELVGAAADVVERATALVRSLRQRLERVAERTRDLAERPRVYAMEWLSPPYNAGHWVPEMVSLAGGEELLGSAGQPSTRLSWEAVVDSQPDAILLMPCGYTVKMIQRELEAIAFPAGWWELPCVRAGQLFALNASAYFSRSGPRVVAGVELLAGLFHPKHFPAPPAADAQRIVLPVPAGRA